MIEIIFGHTMNMFFRFYDWMYFNLRKIKVTTVISFSKIIWKGVNILIWIILGLTVLTSAWSVLPIDTGLNMYVVHSGSMAPAIGTGSLVITSEGEIYEIDDVITYKMSPDDTDTITHRIVEINQEEGTVITKGDANEDRDIEPAPISSIIGKIIFSIPLLGYPIGFAKTTPGIIVMVIIPATIIIYEDIKALYTDLSKAVKNKYAEKIS